MQFGMFFEMEVRPGAYGEAELYRDMVEQAVLAEELGFSVLWLPEHHYNVEYSHISAPDIALMKVAEHTTHLRLGPAIAVLPLTHPVFVAERYATLDLLSGGRLEMGVGRGSYRRWLKTFISERGFTSTYQTRDLHLEALEVIRKAWTQESFTHEGRYFRIAEPISVIPKPLQKPHPRFHCPSLGPDSIDIYPRLGINSMGSTQFRPLERIKPHVERFRQVWKEGLGSEGGLHTSAEGEYSCLVNTHCAPTRRQALDELKPYWEWYADRARDFYFLDHLEEWGGVVPEERKGMLFPGFPDPDWQTFVDHKMINVGDPDDCIRYVEEMERYGIDTFIGMFRMGAMPRERVLASLRLFGKEVIPHFQRKAREAPAVG
ncbi:MAG: LLM class flavin-dependent oxidoreductase [Dehalococcoidia bacterium]